MNMWNRLFFFFLMGLLIMVISLMLLFFPKDLNPVDELITDTTRLSTKPNIIFIMADDLGYECLSCNGGKTYATPNLDSLSAKGIRFTNCFSTPLCTPSRIQALTGLYPFVVDHNNGKYSPE